MPHVRAFRVRSRAARSAAEQEWEQWRADRLRALRAPQGNLALVETAWLPDGERPDLEAASRGLPDGVTLTTVRRTDLVTGAPEYAIRRWDAASPALRAFDGVETYPYDPAWVLEAEYTPSRAPGRCRSSTSGTTADRASWSCRATSPSPSAAPRTR
ncbi:hypothetical protein ACFQVA_31905 [Actinomadura keratinilytica]